MGKKTHFFIIVFLLIIAGASVLSSCKHEPWHQVVSVDTTGGNPTDTTASDTTETGNGDTNHYVPRHPCSPDSVYFANDIYPLIVSYCSDSVHGCHSADFHDDGGPLTTYAQIKRNVNTTTPTKSRLYTVLLASGEDKMPRPPFGPLTSDQINMILTWIKQGAPNNSCDGDCDTTNVTYSKTVWPIIQNACYGCHSGSTPSDNISLTNYNEIKLYVQSGKLLGAINRTPGYFAMPPTATLSECDLNEIKIWIRKGAKNN